MILISSYFFEKAIAKYTKMVYNIDAKEKHSFRIKKHPLLKG